MTKLVKKQNNSKSRIPEFKTREEEAEWFDTNDMGDYQDEFKPVKAVFAKKLSKGMTIQVDSDMFEKLTKEAARKGIGPTTLARIWIRERLYSNKEDS